jgi:hypothetical protein
VQQKVAQGKKIVSITSSARVASPPYRIPELNTMTLSSFLTGKVLDAFNSKWHERVG